VINLGIRELFTSDNFPAKNFNKTLATPFRFDNITLLRLIARGLCRPRKSRAGEPFSQSKI
jgi:hypothetical protein